jgi:hypothetical protein
VFHAGVPILSHPVAPSLKRKLPRVFAAAVSVTGATYVSLGVALAAYFGPAILASCNINWDDYYNTAGGTPGAGPAPWWAAAVAHTVVLFPAIDCLTVFPLNAICMASNLMAAVFSDRSPKMERDRLVRSAFIVLGACVPPLLCAFAVPKLTAALDYTGTIGIAIAAVVPPLLLLAARARCRAVWAPRGGAAGAAGKEAEAGADAGADAGTGADEKAAAEEADRRLFSGNPFRSPWATRRVVIGTCVVGVILFVFCVGTQVAAQVKKG